MIENAKKKYDALNRFSEAYHNLRKCGVDFVYDDSGSPEVRRLNFIDSDTEEHLGEYTTADFLKMLTGQILDEFNLSTDAFPWLKDGDTTVRSEIDPDNKEDDDDH